MGPGFHTLSGGQEQRLCLARSIFSRKPILILDEPTSSLDTRIEGKFYSNLKKIPSNTTILLVTHKKEMIPKDFIIYDLENIN